MEKQIPVLERVHPGKLPLSQLEQKIELLGADIRSRLMLTLCRWLLRRSVVFKAAARLSLAFLFLAVGIGVNNLFAIKPESAYAAGLLLGAVWLYFFTERKLCATIGRIASAELRYKLMHEMRCRFIDQEFKRHFPGHIGRE